MSVQVAEMIIATIIAIFPSVGDPCIGYARDLDQMADDQRWSREHATFSYGRFGEAVPQKLIYLHPRVACQMAAAALVAVGRDPLGPAVNRSDGAMSNLRSLLGYAWYESQFWVRQWNDGAMDPGKMVDGKWQNRAGWSRGFNIARGLFSIGTAWGHHATDEQAHSPEWSFIYGATNLHCLGENPRRRCSGSTTGYGHGLRWSWPRSDFN